VSYYDIIGCLSGQGGEESGGTRETPFARRSSSDGRDYSWLQILSGILPPQSAETPGGARSGAKG